MHAKNYFGALAQQQKTATIQGVMGAERGKNSETTPMVRERKVNREDGKSIINLVKKELTSEAYSPDAEKAKDLQRFRYEDDDLPKDEEELNEIATYIANGLSKHNATYFDNGAAFGKIGEVAFESDGDDTSRVFFSDEQMHAAAILKGDDMQIEVSDGGQNLARRYGNYSRSNFIHYSSDTMPDKGFAIKRTSGITNNRGAFETFIIDKAANAETTSHNAHYDKIEAMIDDVVAHNPEYVKTSDVSFSRYNIDPTSPDEQSIHLPKGFSNTGLIAHSTDYAALAEQLQTFESQVKNIYNFAQKINNQITAHFKQ